MRRSLVALAVTLALATAAGACSTSDSTVPSGPAAPTSSPATGSPHPRAAPSANPCVTSVAHLTAFTNQLGADLVDLRPKVVDPAFDSGGTSAIITRVSGTIVAFEGLEERTAACPATASIVAGVASVRERARTALDASIAASVNDAEVQRASAAALFGLLPDVETIGAATQTAARSTGLDSQIAAIPDDSSKPLGSLPPLDAAPPATAPPRDPGGTYGNAFFGPNASVTTYRVTGSTPDEIIDSILANGPADKWLRGRAEAITLAIPHDRVGFQQDGSTCRVTPTAKPAIYFSFKITIPKWDRPSDASRAAVTWWTSEIRHVAVHENHHVELWRAAGVAMTKTVATSTCTNLVSRLTKIATDTRRENCEFDMEEYGKAMGLSLSACLNS